MRFILLPLLVVGCSWKDLRPTELVQANEADLDERQTHGRALLEQAALAHGAAAYATHETFTVEATDTWEGSGSWWPDDQQRFRAHRVLGTFDSRLTLVDGDEQGSVWGIQDWQPFHNDPAEFVDEDVAIEFYLPTLQYFDELPFRLVEAEHALYAGTSDSGHERVFVTWGRLDAHKEADHYVVYVDPESHRIDRVTYTIREAQDFSPWMLKGLMKPLAVGTMHFRDVREIDGVAVAFDQIVTLGHGEKDKPPQDRVFHRVTVHSAAFDDIAPEDVLGDGSLDRGDGSKPSPAGG